MTKEEQEIVERRTPALAAILADKPTTQPQTGIATAIMHGAVLTVNDAKLEAEIAPLAMEDASAEYQAQQSARKPRSDKGVKRGPIVSKEPEAFKIDDEFVVALTAQQITDLNATAAKLLMSVGLQPHHLTVSPAEWLLNTRVQKHWRTLIGK